MVNAILHLAFIITGKRLFSDMIATRNVEARWQAAERAHKRKGGTVVTVDSPQGQTTYLV